jgi:hypothetical protein
LCPDASTAVIGSYRSPGQLLVQKPAGSDGPSSLATLVAAMLLAVIANVTCNGIGMAWLFQCLRDGLGDGMLLTLSQRCEALLGCLSGLFLRKQRNCRMVPRSQLFAKL